MVHRLANSLTVFRATLGLTVLLNLQHQHQGWAWIFLLIGGITDILDGMITRSSGNNSIWGAKIDPLTDKFLVFAPLTWLTYQGLLPSCAIWLLFTRELLVSGWRSDQVNGGPASCIGKSKTSLQFISLLFLVWPVQWLDGTMIYALHGIGWMLFWPALMLALYSALQYVKIL